MAEDMGRAKEAIRKGYGAFNRGDFDESAKYMHPDVDWQRVADFESQLQGRDAVRLNMEPAVFQKQEIEINRLEAIGDYVVVDTVFRAIGAGSGIEIEQEGFHLWLIKDGMGAAFSFFLDRDEAVRAARKPEGLDSD